MAEKKLWGGRFHGKTAKLMEEFSESISYDYKLIEVDIKASIAHAKMLGKQNIIPKEDSELIIKGLEEILEDFHNDKIVFDESAEDIHMNVEQILREKIGTPAGRLHTGRSRNDQVATDIRLFLKEATKDTITNIDYLQEILLKLSEKNLDIIMPGYTHTQHAQPILLSHHLLAYFWMLERDKCRFADCKSRFDYLPLGSGALAGTTFPIDRDFIAKELGFKGITENSIDSVSDRDFISEFLSASSILMTHLSRFSEEIILWNTTEYSFIVLDDQVTTGSSIMPQKKNPDAAELVRGKTGRVYGSLISLLTLQKGLPMAYNRDLQEDKEPLFDTIYTINMCLKIFRLMLKDAKFNKEIMHKSAGSSYATATDLADYLVKQGIPFREAHEQVGNLVSYCEKNKKELEDLTFEEIKKYAYLSQEDVTGVLTAKSSVEARITAGGTSTKSVKFQLEQAKLALQQSKSHELLNR